MKLKFIDGKSLEQVADEILRNHLIRCYSTISKQYQPIASMNPEDGVDFLFKLRNEGKIRIALDSIGELIECKIIYVN